jgi:disulfide bond formation protein DsbB
MKNLKIDLRLSLYLYIKNLIKRAPSIAVLALTLIVLIYGSASPTTALPVLPDATLTAAATAQPAPPSLNTWSSHGPWGGYVANLAIAPSNPDILYAWTENDVFKSTDGGASWNHAGGLATLPDM